MDEGKDSADVFLDSVIAFIRAVKLVILTELIQLRVEMMPAVIVICHSAQL